MSNQDSDVTTTVSFTVPVWQANLLIGLHEIVSRNMSGGQFYTSEMSGAGLGAYAWILVQLQMASEIFPSIVQTRGRDELKVARMCAKKILRDARFVLKHGKD